MVCRKRKKEHEMKEVTEECMEDIRSMAQVVVHGANVYIYPSYEKAHIFQFQNLSIPDTDKSFANLL